MNIDEKPKIPATSIRIWPETTVISRKTIPERTLRRRRAAARAPRRSRNSSRPIRRTNVLPNYT